MKRDPQLESTLKERQRELGIDRGSRLERVIHERSLERARESEHQSRDEAAELRGQLKAAEKGKK